MSQGQVEVAAGRMGDALKKCGKEKAALAEWARGIQDDLGGKRKLVSKRLDPLSPLLVVTDSSIVIPSDDRGLR